MARIMISATGSGCGKTTLTCGILWALKKRGLIPKALKCGPDYIDPMFHRAVLGVETGNLDSFFMSPDYLKYRLQQQETECDICLLEGAMGFYDGIADTTSASAYEISEQTNTPVILLMNCKGMGIHSILASLSGYCSYRPNQIQAVIFNQLSGTLYEEIRKVLDTMMENSSISQIHCLGYLPKMMDGTLSSRHLGLVTPNEIKDVQSLLQKIGAETEKTVNLDLLLELAESAEPITGSVLAVERYSDTDIRIAIAEDDAFSFYYAENLELLERMGVELVPFSPLKDAGIPKDCAGLYLGGGYPELYVETLSNNTECREDIFRKYQAGMPVIAECGGFLYLHEKLQDKNHQSWPMVGIVQGEAYPTNQLGRFGYITLTENNSNGNCSIPSETDSSAILAHEYHYWDSTACGSDFTARKVGRDRTWQCGYAHNGSYMGFPHLFFYSNPNLIRNFLRAAVDYKEK